MAATHPPPKKKPVLVGEGVDNGWKYQKLQKKFIHISLF